jgi:anti-sigma factor RsiW
MAFEAALAYVDGELDTARGQAYAYVQECNRMDRELIKVREENADWKKSYNRIRSAASRAEDRAKESETKWENAKRDLEVARAALAEAQRPRKHDIEDGTK